jgi:hypothetical protein
MASVEETILRKQRTQLQTEQAKRRRLILATAATRFESLALRARTAVQDCFLHRQYLAMGVNEAQAKAYEDLAAAIRSLIAAEPPDA